MLRGRSIFIVFTCRDETEPEKIADVNAEKPEHWLDDEPDLVPDPSAEKPSDWLVNCSNNHFKFT